MPFIAAVATDAEREYYEDTLYPLQDRVLRVAGAYGDSLVLTGGTALARSYFQHRFSDDIDLFVAGSMKVQHIAYEFFDLVRAAGLAVDLSVNQPGFVRGHIGPARLQVDVAHDLPRLHDPIWNEHLGVFVHALEDIGGNKISAFEDRAEIKDLIDLYYLSENMSWCELFSAADRKRVPIDFDTLEKLMAQPVTGTAILQKPLSIELDRFAEVARGHILREVKKKTDEWSSRIDDVVSDLLWDAPHSERRISAATIPVLHRRSKRLARPQRDALNDALKAYALRFA